MISWKDAYAGKNILVTGGLGFIGSNLVHKLAETTNAKITVVDSLAEGAGGNQHNLRGVARPVEICLADMAERGRMDDLVRSADFIFNLAGQISHVDSMTNPFADMHSNYTAHLALLESCRQHNREVKVVFASTRQVYGRAIHLPANEDLPPNPVDINGIHKLAAEKSHLLYHSVYGIRSVVLRLANTYGPRQLVKHPRQGFIGWFIRKSVDGEEIELYGDGSQLRGIVYVDDMVSALLLAGAVDELYGKVHNIGCTSAYSLKSLAEKLIEISGRGSYRLVEFPAERKRIDIGNAHMDSSRFRESTGWEPKTSVDEGLRIAVRFYEAHRELYW